MGGYKGTITVHHPLPEYGQTHPAACATSCASGHLGAARPPSVIRCSRHTWRRPIPVGVPRLVVDGGATGTRTTPTRVLPPDPPLPRLRAATRSRSRRRLLLLDSKPLCVRTRTTGSVYRCHVARSLGSVRLHRMRQPTIVRCGGPWCGWTLSLI